MNDFILHIGWLTLSMSLIILLVLLFNKLTGKKFSARSRYTVWTVVVLSLCIGIGLFKIPSLFTLEFSMPSFIEDTADVAEQIPTHDERQSPISNTPATVIPTNPAVPGTDNSAPNENTVPNHVPSTPSTTPTSPALTQTPEKEPLHIDVALLIFVIWAIGAVLYFSFGMAVYLRTIRKYDRKIKLCDKQTEGMFRALCRKYGVKRIPGIFYCSEVGSPILYGYTEPTVLLPDIKLSANSLVGVLAHELTHYRRGDIWIKLACLVAESLYWFNPIVHLATARCNAEMELSCDEEVLAGMDEDTRRSYGNVMLEIVEHCSRKRSLLTTQFNPQKNAVKERILNILDMTKKKRGRVIITIALILCVIAGTVIGCTVKDNNNKIKELVYTIEAGVSSVDSLAFENVDTDIITELVIGKDVESIDFAYINTFPALTKVTVDAENENYRSYEGEYGACILLSLRADEIFYIPSTEDNSVYLRNDDALAEQYNANENISLYTCGGVLNVFYTQDEYETYWYLRSLSYDGLTKEIGYDKQISGNCSFRTFRINGGFVATHANYTWSNAFIFKDGAWIEHNPDKEIINGSYGIVSGGDGICFYPGEKGELLYSRITERMVAMQTPDWFLHLTSAEDFWKEDGIVTIAEGALTFTPTKTYTVTDYLAGRGTTVEEEFEQMKENGWFDADKWPYLGCETLEELFAANSIPSELTQFLNKTFTEIEAEGYTLEHLQGNNGWAGWPNYSISGYDGVTLTFRVSYDEATREHLTNVIPDGIEITNPGITINGLRVSMTGEEAKQAVTSWDDVFFSLENGGRNYVTTYNNNNGYKITAYWAMPEEMYNDLLANLPEDGGDEAYVDAKKKLVEPFKDNPVGEIVGLRIEKEPTSETIESDNSNDHLINGFDIRTIGNYPEIEAVIRASLNKEAGELTREDFLSVQYFTMMSKGVSDIAPLAALTNLTDLTLDDNEISDITPLKYLSKLERLNLSSNPITDISVLGSLPRLLSAFVVNCPIDDYSPIAHVRRVEPFEKVTGLRPILSAGTWYSYYKDSGKYKLYTIDYDTSTQKIVWKDGWYGGEWDHIFSGVCTVDDEGFFHGNLYDEIQNVNIQIKFSLYANDPDDHQSNLTFEIREINPEKYKYLIQQPITFTLSSEPAITANYKGLAIELSFWRQGHSIPCMLWGDMPAFFEDNYTGDIFPADVQVADLNVDRNGYYRHYECEGFKAKTYVYDEMQDWNYSLYELYTTRSDIYTYRGIHVGSTLADVKEAYAGEMPSETVENGKITYQDKEYWGSYGPQLNFYIEDNIVTAIELKYSVQR